MPAAQPKIDPDELLKLTEKFVNNGHTLKGLRGIDDKTMETIYGLAYSHYNGGKFDDSTKLFRFLSLFDPYQQRYWMGLGASCQMTKDYEGAIKAYSMAGIVKVDDPKPALYAADCYLILGQKEMAEKALYAAKYWAEQKEDQKDILERATSLLSLMGKNGAEPKSDDDK